jgi:predicted XRE-type DNA-binding protein
MSTAIIEHGSGNIFADLEVAGAGDMMAKAQLAAAILEIIEQRGLKQREAADLLGTDQSYISKLKRGSELRRFTYDRLMDWLVKLDQRITLTVEHRMEHDTGGGIQVST